MAGFLILDKIIFNESHWPTNDREKGILIRSTAYPSAVKYVIKGDSLIILSGNNGVFAFDLDKGEVFINEIRDIIRCYRN